jgi:putative transcriptional regulator
VKKTSLLFENNEEPMAGGFLLSDPFQGDPFFERSVVYLCQHDSDGTFGFVLNNPLALNLHDIIERQDLKDQSLFIGGPVAKNQLFFLHNLGESIANSLACGHDIYFSGDFDSLIEYLDLNGYDAIKLKFFVGYSGWDENQLEEEIKEHSWIAANNIPLSFVFEENHQTLWKSCMELQGSKFKMIANFPKNPNEN